MTLGPFDQGGQTTERDLNTAAARRLAIIRHASEVSGNVSKTCRYYGISRQCYYKWLRLYELHGEAGLRDRSKAPLTSPNATHTEVVGKIIYLRQSYHFGPQRIAMYLKRYHDIEISVSGVWRILKRVDMNRLPASQRYKRNETRWKRYEKPQPGHAVQVDVKFIAPIGAGRRKLGERNIDSSGKMRVLVFLWSENLNHGRALRHQSLHFVASCFPGHLVPPVSCALASHLTPVT